MRESGKKGELLTCRSR